VRSGQALGGFLAGVASVGLDETLRSAGLEYLIGRTPNEVLAGISDHICGDGGLLDDAVARSAVIEVLAEIFDETEDSYDQLRDRWDSQLDEDTIIELMVLFLAQSIFQRFLADLGDRIESNAVSAMRAAECEQEALEFIKRMIEFELGEIDPLTFDWQGPPGEQLIRRNLEAALAQEEDPPFFKRCLWNTLRES